MSEVYDRGLRDAARGGLPGGRGVRCHRGVYVALTGPSYETPAEIRMFRDAGRRRGGHVHRARGDRGAAHGDAGASGLSCLTNMAAGVTDRKLDHREVLETGERVKAALLEVLARIVTEAARER